MTGRTFEIPVACMCGFDVDAINIGKPQANSFTTSIVRCTSCHKCWQVSVSLRPVVGNPEAAERKRRQRQAVPA